jgi:hypothetical protein
MRSVAAAGGVIQYRPAGEGQEEEQSTDGRREAAKRPFF